MIKTVSIPEGEVLHVVTDKTHAYITNFDLYGEIYASGSATSFDDADLNGAICVEPCGSALLPDCGKDLYLIHDDTYPIKAQIITTDALNANFSKPSPRDSRIVDDGDGTLYLADDGKYKEAYGIDYTLQSNAVCPYANRVEITASGTWTVPENIKGKVVDIFLVGGGGGACYNVQAGGGGGYCKLFKNIRVTPGEAIPITIGAGGAGSISNEAPYWGTAGGQTMFKSSSYSAAGGGEAYVRAAPSYLFYGGGSGGSGGAISFVGANAATEHLCTLGGINGGHGQAHFTDHSYYGCAGKGQGSTMDPYSGIIYAPGGSCGASATTQTVRGAGGNAGSSTLANLSGIAGICVIYYNTMED